MTTPTRLYHVLDVDADMSRLVDATNGAAAVRHVTSKRFRVTVATAKVVAELVRDGVQVETAGKEPAVPEPGPAAACPHGAPLGSCNACDVASDFAHDAAREARAFGGR